MLSRLLNDPLLNFQRGLGVIYLFIAKFRRGISIGKGVVFKGIPILQNYGGYIEIADHVTLYSTPYGYFAHMSGRTRLFVEDGGRISIGDNVRINGATLHARSNITIGDGTLIAANTSILDSNGHPLSMESPDKRLTEKDEPKDVVIGNNVWIGLNCTILKGVKIGDGAVIGTGTVVNKDIPAGAIAYGSPVQIKADKC